MNTGTYESLILTEKGNAELVELIIDECKEIISNNEGNFERVDDWGIKKLAYEIKGNLEATFTLLTFKGTREIVRKLEAYLKTDEKVLRHIFIRIN